MRRSSKRKWDDCTKLNSIEKLHRWEVNNFVELYNENSHWKFGLESNHFSPLNNEMLEFSAILPPRSTEEDGKEYLPIIIYPWKIPKSLEGKITMKMIISIVGTKTYCREYEKLEVYNHLERRDMEFLELTELLDSSNGYLCGNDLILLIKLILHYTEPMFENPSKSESLTTSEYSLTCPIFALSHHLIIDNFKMMWEKKPEKMPMKIESDVFAPERDDIGLFITEFWPISWKNDHDVEIGIRSNNCVNAYVNVQFSLFNKSGEECLPGWTHRFDRQLNTKSISFPKQYFMYLLKSIDQFTLVCKVYAMVDNSDITTFSSNSICEVPFSSTSIKLDEFPFYYVTQEQSKESFFKESVERNILLAPFSPLTDSTYQFKLHVHSKKEYRNDVMISLHFTSSFIKQPTKVQWRTSLVDTNANEWTRTFNEFRIYKNSNYGLHKLISRSELENNKDLLLPNDKLTLKIELWIYDQRAISIENFHQKTDKNTGIKFGDNCILENVFVSNNATTTMRNLNQTHKETNIPKNVNKETK